MTTPSAEAMDKATRLFENLENSIRIEWDWPVLPDEAKVEIAAALDAFAAEASADQKERDAKIAREHPGVQCPFEADNDIEPHEPCPVCGDINDMEAPTNCQGRLQLQIAAAIRKQP